VCLINASLWENKHLSTFRAAHTTHKERACLYFSSLCSTLLVVKSGFFRQVKNDSPDERQTLKDALALRLHEKCIKMLNFQSIKFSSQDLFSALLHLLF